MKVFRWQWLAMLSAVVHSSLATERLGLDVSVSLPPAPSSSPTVTLSWQVQPSPAEVLLSWSQCTKHKTEMSCREMGRQTLADPASSSYVLTGAVKYDSQHIYLITLRTEDVCGDVNIRAAYVTVPQPITTKLNQNETSLYLVIGPIHSHNITVKWGELGTGPPVSPVGYLVTWRRVFGGVGHPGHQSGVVQVDYTIRGLIPGTRYEVCVVDQRPTTTRHCGRVETEEEVPGPPEAGTSWCSNAAHGTHWQCDVTWGAPLKPNGRITGYTIYWRDSEGYTLHQVQPLGSQCSPPCHSSAVVTFLPHEGCVVAHTAVGVGWEVCTRVHDTRSRLLAVFEARLLYAAAGVLLLYVLGPRVIGAVLRFCIRGITPHLVESNRRTPPV